MSCLYEGMAMGFYVFIGCGASTLNKVTIGQGPTMSVKTDAASVAFAYAFVTAAMIYTVSHRSGGHVNPAVTLSYMLTGDCRFWEGVAILVGQAAGAFGGCALLTFIIPSGTDDALGANRRTADWNDDEGYIRVIVAEGVCMLFILMVYYEVGINKNSIARSKGETRAILAPLAIGLAIYAAHAFLIPIDGCSVNPARSAMTAIYAWWRDADGISDIWKDLWAMLIGQGIAVACMVGWMYMLRARGYSADAETGNNRTALRSASMYGMNEDVEIATTPATAKKDDAGFKSGGDDVEEEAGGANPEGQE